MLSKFTPFSELQFPSRRRRNLPHWDVPGATYFLTFRLADSMPAGVVQELNRQVAVWLKLHGLATRGEIQRLPAQTQSEFRKLISVEEERWLDAGHGACVLRDPDCRQHVIDALKFFDGQRYALDAFVVMPNHVHLLILPMDAWTPAPIVASWKQYSARRINALLGQSGALWQEETFDHIVRHAAKLEECRRYIAANPVKARLRSGEFEVGCGIGIAV